MQVEDREPFERDAILLLIGNVGHLFAKIPLIPDARPDGGRFNLLIATPRTTPGRLRPNADVLFRRKADDNQSSSCSVGAPLPSPSPGL